MNIGKMLVSLGFEQEEIQEGFPCPTVINSRELSTTPLGYGAETLEEIAADIDYRKTIGERAATIRSSGNWS